MLPRFRFNDDGSNPELEFVRRLPDGIYSVGEGQFRVEIRNGHVLWTAAILGGDAEDWLAGCEGISARPMTVDEIKMTIRFALTSHEWGRILADAMGGKE